MIFNFYGYEMRSTDGWMDFMLAHRWLRRYWPEIDDQDLIMADWRQQRQAMMLEAGFWLRPESFLISWRGQPAAFLRVREFDQKQYRLHLLEAPGLSGKLLVRGITKLIPLIEKALEMRGVRAIVISVREGLLGRLLYRMGYDYMTGWTDPDGWFLAKPLGGFVISRAVLQGQQTAFSTQHSASKESARIQ